MSRISWPESPTVMVIDSEDNDVKRSVVEACSDHLIRFYYGDDLIGKRSWRGCKECNRYRCRDAGRTRVLQFKRRADGAGARGKLRGLIKAMGGKELSAYGLCHLGDYEATVFSRYSRNREYGELLIRGKKRFMNWLKVCQPISLYCSLLKSMMWNCPSVGPYIPLSIKKLPRRI